MDDESGAAPFGVAVPGAPVAGVAKLPCGSDEVMYIPEFADKPPGADEKEPEEKYGVAYVSRETHTHARSHRHTQTPLWLPSDARARGCRSRCAGIT